MTRLQSRLFLRTLSRNNDVYVLKVVTLAIAFATGILVTLFSIHEFGFDRHHKDPDALFRVLTRNTNKDHTGNRLSAFISSHSFRTIQRKQVKSAIARVKALHGLKVLASGRTFDNQHIHVTDTNIDNVFSFEVEEGGFRKFKETGSPVAVISRNRAAQYFGDRSPMGDTIRLTTYGDTVSFVVVGVYKDFPDNSHEDFEFFIKYDSETITHLNFDPEQSNVYARVSEEASTYSMVEASDDHTELFFQPVTKIYFGPRVMFEESRHGDLYSMWILIGIVSLIFLLAVCSFVNLTTITLPYRSKEIAVKKLAGSTQRQLLMQFIQELFTLAGASILLAMILLLVVSEYVSPRLGVDVFRITTAIHPALWGIVLLMFVVVIMSPTLIVVRFIRATPTRLLSTDTINFPKFKRTIAIVQFGVSVFLIVSSSVVRRQIDYSLLKEPGQNNDQIVYIACPVNISDSAIYRIRGGWPGTNPKILDVIAASQLPGQLKSKSSGNDFFALQVDYNFMDFFNLKMLGGRWFKPTDDDSATVLNQMAQKKIKNAGDHVIGTIENLNGPLNKPEQSVKIRLAPNGNYNWLCFRVLEVDIRTTIQWIERRMAAKGSHGRAYFLNPHFESWLNYQDRLNALSALLTIVSAILAVCAIYGLSVSLVRDNLRTIAVHQLFGARTTAITRLLAFELFRYMLTALLFFGPITYLFLNELLRSFVYATKFAWTDPLYPIGYCVAVILGLCFLQAYNMNRCDFVAALKGRS